MSDVIKTATQYHSRLKAELAKVEEFLRMAEEFSREGFPEARPALAKSTAKDMPLELPAMELARRTPKEAIVG